MNTEITSQIQDSLKDFIIECLKEKNAEDIYCIHLKDKASIADYMIFASGRSSKNIKAIAEYTALELKHKMKCSSNVEGMQCADWILLDAGEVIVHLFHPEARQKFKLEELWRN